MFGRRPTFHGSVLGTLALSAPALRCLAWLDEAARLAGAGVVAIVHRRSLTGLARRRAPALAPVAPFAPFAVAIPLANQAVSGDFRRSGDCLFDDGYGWTTTGFGAGPSKHPHTRGALVAFDLATGDIGGAPSVDGGERAP